MSRRYFAALGQGLYATQLLEMAVARFLVACRAYDPGVAVDDLMRDVGRLDKLSLGQLARAVGDRGGSTEAVVRLGPLVEERNQFVHHFLRTAPTRSFAETSQDEEIQGLVGMTRRFIAGARSIGSMTDGLMDMNESGRPSARDGGFALVGRAFTLALQRISELEWEPKDLASSREGVEVGSP